MRKNSMCVAWRGATETCFVLSTISNRNLQPFAISTCQLAIQSTQTTGAHNSNKSGMQLQTNVKKCSSLMFFRSEKMTRFTQKTLSSILSFPVFRMEHPKGVTGAITQRRTISKWHLGSLFTKHSPSSLTSSCLCHPNIPVSKTNNYKDFKWSCTEKCLLEYQWIEYVTIQIVIC